MNKELELEAEKYTKSKQWGNSTPTNWVQNIFIAGATSKFVEKQKLEFAINLLKVIEEPNGDLLGNKIKLKIEELQQQLG